MATIAVIDDDEAIRHVLRSLLKNQGHTIVDAKDGFDGLSVIENTRPDLIILDVMMPDMDGWVLCEKVKEDPRLKHIPIIMLTVRDTAKDIMKSMETSADWHLAKPFNNKTLLDTIDKLLE